MANVLSLVSYKIFPAKLGGQKGIALFNKYFSAYHTVVCVTIKDNDPAYANYKVLNILSNSKLRYINVFYFFTISRIIKKYRISHLIVEHPYYGWLGLWLKKFCRIKMITHSHNIEAQRFKSVGKWWWLILRQYEKYIYQQSDKVFCISEEDRKYIIANLKVTPQKCTVITYGIEWDHAPTTAERLEAKMYLENKYDIAPGTILYFFNGTLDYMPNLNAVKIILNEINPVLLSSDLNYKIIICGKNLPAQMNELKEYSNKNIIYAGFVDDVSIYFKGTDIFINPVTDGGGIKTKLVEALGYDLAAVSTFNGAVGIDKEICNGKLVLVNGNDWKFFANKMKEVKNISSAITTDYFEHFYWNNIAGKAGEAIDNL
ncbi:MAG: glycosyltransferase family 4 protein [Ginsengibacter sp.]